MSSTPKVASARAYVRGCARSIVATLLAAVANLCHADDNPLSDVNYRLGDGLRVPGLGIGIGGYATGTYDKLRTLPGRAAIGDLSLSVWWEGVGRWKVFSEFDYENTLSSRSAGMQDEDRYLALERFYVDYAANESTTVRVGKFLTPVGRWNLIHATPLVWTTSRPLVTTLAFPTNVTGLMVTGALPDIGSGLDYSVYGSTGDEVRPNPQIDTFREAIGLRVVASLPAGGQLGFSYASFEQDQTGELRKQLYGLDFFWTQNHFEVSGEGVYRVLHDAQGRNDGGGFIQVVAPLSGKLFAIGRYESYRQSGPSSSTRLWVAGLSYRFNPAVVLKAEWVKARPNETGAPEGFLSSISVLF